MFSQLKFMYKINKLAECKITDSKVRTITNLKWPNLKRLYLSNIQLNKNRL